MKRCTCGAVLWEGWDGRLSCSNASCGWTNTVQTSQTLAPREHEDEKKKPRRGARK